MQTLSFAFFKYNGISFVVLNKYFYLPLYFIMKKPLLWLVGLAALSALFVGIANADLFVSDVFSNGAPKVDNAYTLVLNNYDNYWWYTEDDLIWGDFIDGNLHVTAPTKEDIGYDVATVYYMFVSPYRISQIKSWDPSVDTSKIIMQQVEIDSNAQNVEFEVLGVDPEQSYYGFVSPVDMYDGFGTPSNEMCFKLSTNTYNQGAGCDAFELVMDPSKTTDDPSAAVQQEQLWVGCVWMDMANISHVVKWDTITLKWTAVDGNIVQIAIFDPNEEYWRSLGVVNMSDEKFDYKMQWNGEQNFMLTNGCGGEVRYKADAAMGTPEPDVVPPATWPAENVLYIAIAAVILYGAYVLFFRKSEN